MNAHESSELELRAEAGRRITLLGAVVNGGLAILKGAAGILGGSSAMVADAAHSVGDLVTDGVALVALRAASKPADDDHPYGHGRFETLGTIVLALVLLGAAVSIVAEAVGRATEPGAGGVPEVVALWAAVLSILANEFLYRVTVRVGRRTKSPLLLANAWHHRSDAFSSVAALIGIAGARMGYPVLDPLAAAVVGAQIAQMSVRMLLKASRELTEEAQERPLLRSLEPRIRELAGVVNVHELRARRMGPSLLVDLHVEVDGMTSVSDGHQVAERVRLFVMEELDGVTDVLVHIDPEPDLEVDPSATLAAPRAEIEERVRDVAGVLPEVRAVTHVQIHYLSEGVTVEVNIVLDDALTIARASEIAAVLRQRLEGEATIDVADIHLELDD